MLNAAFPKIVSVRQKFPGSPALDIRRTVERELFNFREQFKPGSSIAVGVGSRGISNLAEIVGAVLEALKAAGARPFIIPAMGSHGGATPEGQTQILAEYRVTEERYNVPIRAGMEVERLGRTPDGFDVYFSA